MIAELKIKVLKLRKKMYITSIKPILHDKSTCTLIEKLLLTEYAPRVAHVMKSVLLYTFNHEFREWKLFQFAHSIMNRKLKQ
jgi:hypothetical protein